MAELIKLKTISDSRGDLTVIEKDLPFKKSYNAAYSFDDVKNYGFCDVFK